MESKKLGNAIRTIRRKKGLTQQQLGHKAGVTWEMVSRYERGLSSALPRLEILGKALRTNPAEIYAMAYNITLADQIESNKVLHISKFEIQNLKEISTLKEFLKAFQKGYSYSTPKWITQLDKDSYLIDSNVIQNLPIIFKNTKDFYISPNSIPQNNDYILQIKSGALELNQIKDKNAIYLGILIANQNRYR